MSQVEAGGAGIEYQVAGQGRPAVLPAWLPGLRPAVAAPGPGAGRAGFQSSSPAWTRACAGGKPAGMAVRRQGAACLWRVARARVHLSR